MHTSPAHIQTVDVDDGWELEGPSHERNIPTEESPIQITTATTTAVVTPTTAATEKPSPTVGTPSRIGTAALVGILVALGVVFVAALVALACIRRRKNQRREVERSRRRNAIEEDEGDEAKAPPSYETAVFGSTDNTTWNQHYGVYNPPPQPEHPILQSPEPVHYVIHSPRPVNSVSNETLSRLDPVAATRERPVSAEIIIFPHDSPPPGPEDNTISLQAALRMSQQSNTVLYSQPTASGRFTENFNDTASEVSDLSEEERIAVVELV